MIPSLPGCLLVVAGLAVPARPGALASYELGWEREQKGDLAGAAEAYEHALTLSPSLAEARDRLGFVRGQQGRTEEALAEFEKATKSRPDLFDAWYHLGATRWWTGDAAGALPALQPA